MTSYGQDFFSQSHDTVSKNTADLLVSEGGQKALQATAGADAATTKVGFFGATAVTQQGPVPDPTAGDAGSNSTAINGILTALRALGLIAAA